MTLHRRSLLSGATLSGLTLAGTTLAGPAGARAAGETPAPNAGPASPVMGLASGEASPSRALGGMELAILARAPSTPTGLAISRGGRVFLMMPRFTGAEPFTLGEVTQDGAVRPYPDAATNRPDAGKPQASLFHAPNGVFDGDDALWVLDAGLPEGKGAPVPGGAKILRIDIAAGRVAQVVPLDAGVTATSSLNDLRVRVEGGRALAYVTDQGQDGEGAILAVDLATGQVARRLAGHASTRSQAGLVKFVEGRPVMETTGDGPPRAPKGGANGVALSPDGARLYYAPLMSRRLYGLDTAGLLDPGVTDAQVAARVVDLGEKGMTGGLTTDAKGRVYLSLQEHNAVGRWNPDGTVETLASDPRLVWADTFWITPDRWLYISAAQVNRRPEFNRGRDLQAPPYAVLRMRIDADPA